MKNCASHSYFRQPDGSFKCCHCGTIATFAALNTGDRFDFISGLGNDSFFKRCEKISPKRYADEDENIHRIGSVKAKVYNVTTAKGRWDSKN